MRVLLVEDETEMAGLIAGRLAAHGLIVDHFTCLAEAEEAVVGAPYGLAICDRRLPDGDGARLVAVLRRHRPDCAVILLTAMDAVGERIDGLDAGADDYISKPFHFDELMARIRVQLRRHGPHVLPGIEIGRVRFDPSSREAWLDDRPMLLPRRELALLGALMARGGRVVPRDLLTEQIYGYDDEIQSNALDALVSRLRRRIEGAGLAIHTIRGVGYMLAKT